MCIGKFRIYYNPFNFKLFEFKVSSNTNSFKRYRKAKIWLCIYKIVIKNGINKNVELYDIWIFWRFCCWDLWNRSFNCSGSRPHKLRHRLIYSLAFISSFDILLSFGLNVSISLKWIVWTLQQLSNNFDISILNHEFNNCRLGI